MMFQMSRSRCYHFGIVMVKLGLCSPRDAIAMYHQLEWIQGESNFERIL